MRRAPRGVLGAGGSECESRAVTALYRKKKIEMKGRVDVGSFVGVRR
jgi:hypothetical protein